VAYVLDYLQGRGVVFTVIPHPKAETARGEARLLRLPEEIVAETVVVMTRTGPALMVIPVSRSLDMWLAAEAVGDPHVRLATDRELADRFPDYELGALPPLSMLLLVPMYVDPSIAEQDKIVFAAGRRDVSVLMATRDLFGSDPVVITPLTSESRVSAPSG